MKKNIAWILICVIFGGMCCGHLLTLTASAVESTAEVTAEIITEDASQMYPEIAETGGISEKKQDFHTIYTRLWEYCNENRTELLGILGDALIFLLALLIKVKNDKKTNAITNSLEMVRKDASGTHHSQGSVVGAVNTMIDGYNEMRLSYEKYEGVEDDRNKLIGAVFVQNTALLEILATVYQNSKNLPQGVKDLINLKYANCLKRLENEDSLRAVTQAVRDAIRAESVKDEQTEDTELKDEKNTEV